MFNKLKNFVITGKEKAVVGFLVGAVGSYLAENGLTLKDVLTASGLKALAVGVAVHIFVYLKANSGLRG